MTEKKFNYKCPADAPEDWSKCKPGNWALFGAGVSFHESIKDNAKMMLLTLLPYIIIMIPSLMYDKPTKPGPDGKRPPKSHDTVVMEANKENFYALLSLIACISLFCYYLYKEWVNSRSDGGGIQDKIAEANIQAMQDGVLTLRGAMAKFRDSTWANQRDLDKALKNPDAVGEVRTMCKILAPFFRMYDSNGDNIIDMNEFKLIFKDVNENISKESMERMFKAADVDNSEVISFEEFVACILCFALESEGMGSDDHKAKIMVDPSVYYSGAADDEEEEQEDEDIPEDLADLSPEEQQKRIKQRAFSMMGLGTLLVVVFSDPMVDLLGAMGKQLGIGAFYIAFVLAPMASNASELVAASNYAAKKTMKSMTTSLSTLEGAAVMNNTFTTGVFMVLIYARGIAWEFQAETIVIVFIQICMGVMMMNLTHQLLVHACFVFSLYPLALAVTWALENKLGID